MLCDEYVAVFNWTLRWTFLWICVEYQTDRDKRDDNMRYEESRVNYKGVPEQRKRSKNNCTPCGYLSRCISFDHSTVAEI